MAIGLAGAINVNAATNTLPGTITTASFTPATGELIIVKAITEDSGATLSSPTATGGGIAWTLRHEAKVASTCASAIYSGIVTSGGTGITVSISTVVAGAVTAYFSMAVERWTGAQLGTSPAIGYLSGQSTTTTITTTGTSSIVSYLDGDWNANAPGTPTYASSAIQDGLDNRSPSNYVGYYAYQNAATAGVQTFGVTSPTGRKDTLVGIEVQPSAAPAGVNHNLLTLGVGF